MKKTALALAVVMLSVCFGLPVQKADTSAGRVEQTTMNLAAAQGPATARGPVTADIADSDEFFQNAINSGGPERDNSQKIEALLKRMTLEEKVGQMTQLTLGM